MSEIYDVIILGAGPAGLAAGLYAGRSRLNVLIIEKGQDGGQIAITDEIENYPGQIVEGESGPSLIARMTKQAEKFGRPILTFIDTPGAYPGKDAEERGQGEAIAENMYEMMTAKTPILSIVIGEGGSGGALALAVADEVWMTENAVYSVISPEGAASILWKDAKRAKEAAESLRLTAQDLYDLGVIENIIPAVQTREVGMPRLKQALSEAFSRRAALDTAALLEQRYRKFRGIGGGEA